ncbi:hypothetical protein [Vannielia litorea]|uniref:hypothetical protein n=1 Tax=Vannielia litorea TaxID=1217970 RepID=UPI001C94AB76|nr:hypothetical protein [Vannielia litorea]MBY6048006.1 hypothetical protein [Vannielia litorea]MBY6075420.1 hypothetical protein [Vannielia litorea]
MTVRVNTHPTTSRALIWGAAFFVPMMYWALWLNVKDGWLLLPLADNGRSTEPLPFGLGVIAGLSLAFGLGTAVALWQARFGSLRSIFLPGPGRFALCFFRTCLTPYTSIAIFPMPVVFVLGFDASAVIAFAIYLAAWLIAAGLIISGHRPKVLRVLLFGQNYIVLWSANLIACGHFAFRV